MKEGRDNPKLIYLYPEKASFVSKDIAALSARYNVVTNELDWSNKRATPINFIRQLFFLLKNMGDAKAIIVMFASYTSFLPALLGKLMGKPVYLILGGTDCVSFPLLNYGSLRRPLLGTFVKWSCRLATGLLPVHESLIRYRYTYLPEATHELQGIAHFCPLLNTPWRAIHNGFAIDYFNAPQGDKQPLSFICVAAIDGERRFRVKGMDSLLHLAHRFPQCRFTVVGVADEARQLFGELPENLTIYPFLDKAVFRELLSAARFYLQLSLSEGFPNALCEAMLSECVPIGSRVGGIPFIINNTGFVMNHHATDYQEGFFEEIIASDEAKLLALGKLARARVRKEFPMEVRAAALFDVLENGIGPGQSNDYICPV